MPLPVFSASTSAVKLATPASVCTTTSASISADFTGSCASRVGDAGEPLGPVEALARQQLDLAVVDAHLDAVAVVFDLVHPVRARRRLLDGGGQHRLDELRQLLRLGLGQRRRIDGGLAALARLLPGCATSPPCATTTRGPGRWQSPRCCGRWRRRPACPPGCPARRRVRAASSSDLNSSQASCFSRGFGAIRTRCQTPFSFSPLRRNLRCPLR